MKSPGDAPKDYQELINGRYGVLRELGAGGMGTVFEAYDRHLLRHVAIKRCHLVDSKWRKRFLQEAIAQAQLSHPNIVQIFDVCEDEGRKPFIVMEYFPSRAVQDQLAHRRSFAFDDAMRISRTTAARAKLRS